MTTNHWGNLVCTKEEFDLLRKVLGEQGVNALYSATDTVTYHVYIRNPYREAVALYGTDLEMEVAKDFFCRHERGY